MYRVTVTQQNVRINNIGRVLATANIHDKDVWGLNKDTMTDRKQDEIEV